MAKRAGKQNDLDRGNIKATGVGLREGELDALEAMGAELGKALQSGVVARNSLIRIAVRRMIEAYQSKSLTLAELTAYFTVEEKPKPRLRL